jgi:hypothetical protein
MACKVVSRPNLSGRDWYDASELQKCKCSAHIHVFNRMRTKPVSVAAVYGAANSMRCTKRGAGNYYAPGRGSTWLLDAAFIDRLAAAEATEIRRQNDKKKRIERLAAAEAAGAQPPEPALS